jgi:transaldolase
MRFPPAFPALVVISTNPTSISAFSPRHHYRPINSSTRLFTSALESLADLTTLSIDSGSIDTVAKYAKTGLITDATTNPLFVSQAGSNGDARYEAMVMEAVTYAKSKTCAQDGCDVPDETLNLAVDRLAVNLGKELVGLVDGRVSTEVDIRLSYDTEASVERARTIIAMYEEMGVSRDRILIKLAGTWEGIQAARQLEKEGIQCNITLVFSFLQAAAAAQAGAYLISPFPGRILDWHKKQSGKEGYEPDVDPGVLAVKRMYSYFRKYGYKTICMPASWRPSRGANVEGSDVDEILALAGVDEMTIPEPLLNSLSSMPANAVKKKCDAKADGASCTDPDFTLTEESYKSYWGADDCGKEKLKEGIDAFTVETEKLIKILIEKF